LGAQGIDALGLLGVKVPDPLLDLGDFAFAVGIGQALANPANGRLDLLSLVYIGDHLSRTIDQLVEKIAHGPTLLLSRRSDDWAPAQDI
jgi:hypothetical protein